MSWLNKMFLVKNTKNESLVAYCVLLFSIFLDWIHNEVKISSLYNILNMYISYTHIIQVN